MFHELYLSYSAALLKCFLDFDSFMHAFVPRKLLHTRNSTTYIAGITALTKVFIGQFIASEVATASSYIQAS